MDSGKLDICLHNLTTWFDEYKLKNNVRIYDDNMQFQKSTKYKEKEIH
jgi:hypothetical protein